MGTAQVQSEPWHTSDRGEPWTEGTRNSEVGGHDNRYFSAKTKESRAARSAETLQKSPDADFSEQTASSAETYCFTEAESIAIPRSLHGEQMQSSLDEFTNPEASPNLRREEQLLAGSEKLQLGSSRREAVPRSAGWRARADVAAGIRVGLYFVQFRVP